MIQKMRRAAGIHPDLLRVLARLDAMPTAKLNMMVLEGLRTIERQRELVKKGASTTLRSRHLTGHAVDLGVMLGDELRWDWPLYHKAAPIIKAAAAAENVLIEWGGDWKTFKDGPHWQLPWKAYPK
jgi:peptidoglycan L-alanyl-D-glutamate endopeptidase CwlK